MNETLFQPAQATDAEKLADIRVAAMKPSLQALGRFDPHRARQRFLSTFEPSQTWTILLNGDLVGFFVVRQHPDHIWFDHLYLHPDAQRLGLGRKVVRHVQDEAMSASKPIRLMALKHSSANDFYMSLGFRLEKQAEFDNHYRWDVPGRTP